MAINSNKFIAHSINEEGDYHYLEDHLLNTARRTRIFTEKWRAGNLGYYLGQVHDLGKYSHQFQKYLLEDSAGVEHSIAGAVYLSNNKGIPFNEILGFIVAGHHAGLHNLADLKNAIQLKKDKSFIAESITQFKKEIAESKPKESIGLDMNNPYDVEFFIRMMYSALVDADFLDTEQHFNLNLSSNRKYSYSLKNLWKKFKRNQEKLELEADKTFINEMRSNIYKEVIDKSELNNGFFSLTIPTGGGKTRTGLAFALKHAIRNNLDRIIVVIPYTNIIEQTAKVYKEILGEENILEHHSNMVINEKEEESREYQLLKLATENWDMPIIVTTSVQFFESLFAHKVSKVRKNHNLANAVMIFDEVQTLPPEYLNPIIQVMNQLVNKYNSSIIFSTATQPAFKTRDNFKGIDKIKELAPSPRKLYEKLKRVKFNFHYLNKKIDWQTVMNLMLSQKQALTVVNTRDDAQALFKTLNDKTDSVYHLSTNMCAVHRREVISEVKKLLEDGLPCYLVSTQLIEAGVDIDFPLVLRAMGPLDSIVQAAGRCNREGKLERGEVIIFEPENNHLPRGIYSTATGKTKIFLKEPEDLQKPDIFLKYFDSLYGDVNCDKYQIQTMRKNFNFREVNYKFKMIPDETVNIIIENNKIVDALPVSIRLIDKKGFISREEWRRLQPYIVSVSKYKVNIFLKNDYLYELIEGVYIWKGKYDRNIGIVEGEFNFDDLYIGGV